MARLRQRERVLPPAGQSRLDKVLDGVGWIGVVLFGGWVGARVMEWLFN